MLRFQVCLQDNPACVKKPPASKFCYSLQLHKSVGHDDQGALEIKSSMGTKSKSFVARVPGPRPGGLFVIEKKFFGQPCSLDVVVRCGLHDNHRSHFLLSFSLSHSLPPFSPSASGTKFAILCDQFWSFSAMKLYPNTMIFAKVGS